MDLVLKVKRVLPNAVLPAKAHPSDLGWDLFCAQDAIIPSLDSLLIRTGVAIQFPPYVGGILKDRSGVASKQGLFIHAGVIDPNYRGEILVLMYNSKRNHPVEVLSGAKIAQLILLPAFQLTAPLEEVAELDATDRGPAGFGSTGD